MGILAVTGEKGQALIMTEISSEYFSQEKDEKIIWPEKEKLIIGQPHRIC